LGSRAGASAAQVERRGCERTFCGAPHAAWTRERARPGSNSMSEWMVSRLLATILAMLLATLGCSTTSASSHTGIAPAKVSPTGTTGSEISDALGSCRLQEGGRLPDPGCSPGALNPDITPDPALLGRTICKPGWTASVRPKDSDVLKQKVLLRYGIAPTRLNLARYEMDIASLSRSAGRLTTWPTSGQSPGRLTASMRMASPRRGAEPSPRTGSRTGPEPPSAMGG
jgi:hypothetical protein